MNIMQNFENSPKVNKGTKVLRAAVSAGHLVEPVLAKTFPLPDHEELAHQQHRELIMVHYKYLLHPARFKNHWQYILRGTKLHFVKYIN